MKSLFLVIALLLSTRQVFSQTIIVYREGGGNLSNVDMVLEAELYPDAIIKGKSNPYGEGFDRLLYSIKGVSLCQGQQKDTIFTLGIAKNGDVFVYKGNTHQISFSVRGQGRKICEGNTSRVLYTLRDVTTDDGPGTAICRGEGDQAVYTIIGGGGLPVQYLLITVATISLQ